MACIGIRYLACISPLTNEIIADQVGLAGPNKLNQFNLESVSCLRRLSPFSL